MDKNELKEQLVEDSKKITWPDLKNSFYHVLTYYSLPENWRDKMKQADSFEITQEVVEDIPRDNFINALRKGICTVIFTKSDGSVRTMKCTLNESVLPEPSGKTSTRRSNPDVISAWDIEKEGWRSFRIDSVTEFYPPLSD